MVSYYVVVIPQACLVAAVILLLRAVVWFVNMLFIMPLSDPLRHLPGPDGTFLESHLQQVMDPEVSPAIFKDWRTRFGKTFRFQGFGRHDLRLMSLDFCVISHVLANESLYKKPWQTRSFLSQLIGKGIFSLEGEEHAFQRRIVSPAFRSHSLTKSSAIFFRKAEEVCDLWSDIIAVNDKPHQEDGPSVSNHPQYPPKISSAVVDVAHWISRASFDVIGLAGFGYNFHSLTDQSEEVYCAYRKMFNVADKGLGLWKILELYFPILRKIWVTADIRTTNESLKIIAKAGKAIVAARKKALSKATGHDTEDQDLLTLLIKSSNLYGYDRLSDQELLDQCSTFLLAGSDSVSVAISWCLYFLSTHPEIQMRLRKELSGAPYLLDECMSDVSVDSGFADTSTKARWQEIANMPFLDFVVRETLRLRPPVHSTIRVAMQDDAIPVFNPITTRDGEMIAQDPQDSTSNCIYIRKGTYVHIPIEGFNHSEDVWGRDAAEFNPIRWKDLSPHHYSKPGIRNQMTFGYGHSSCLGHRFAIAEMKAFIATIIPQFELCPAGDVKISRYNSIITRPYVEGKWSQGPQMPISIRKLM